MVSGFSKSIILFLTVLQFFAPLVHAHTGNSAVNLGLHIPGLEQLASGKHTPVSQNVNPDWLDEGLAVMVDAGIRQNQDGLAYESSQTMSFMAHRRLPLAALPENDQSFFPPRTPFALNNRLDSVIAPRAPPAQ